MKYPLQHTNSRLSVDGVTRTLWPVWFLILAMFSTLGCSKGGHSDQKPESTKWPKGASEMAESAPQSYVELAGLLSDGPYDRQELPALTSDSAYARARVQRTLLALRQIETSDGDIRFVRDEVVAATGEMMRTFDTLEQLPRPPDFVTQFASTIMLIGLGQMDTVLENDRAIAEQNEFVERGIKQLELADRRLKAAVLMLRDIGAEYAGPRSNVPRQIEVDVDEAWPTANSAWLTLVNGTGRELHDCTFAVKIAGPDKRFKPHVHFIAAWKPGQPIFFHHDHGIMLQGTRLGDGLPSRIERVTVDVFAREFSQLGIEYIYSSEERDKDTARYCEELEFTARFQEFKSGLFDSDLPAIMCKFTGLSRLPAGTATITLPSSKANKVKFQQWLENEELEVEFPHLETLPPQFELRLRFEGAQTDVIKRFEM